MKKLMILLFVLALAGCGGGGGSSPTSALRAEAFPGEPPARCELTVQMYGEAVQGREGALRSLGVTVVDSTRPGALLESAMLPGGGWPDAITAPVVVMSYGDSDAARLAEHPEHPEWLEAFGAQLGTVFATAPVDPWVIFVLPDDPAYAAQALGAVDYVKGLYAHARVLAVPKAQLNDAVQGFCDAGRQTE